MPPIVDFPTIVKDALEVFGDLCANAPERHHFAEYLTGLMIGRKEDRQWYQPRVCGHHGSILSQPLAH